MMNLYAPGDKGRAICHECGLVTTTFAYKDVPFSDGSGLVKDILVAVCDQCASVVAIPPQSTPAIKAEREKATVSLEAVLPAVYLEALDLACYRIEPKAGQDFRKRLLTYYVHSFAHNVKAAEQLAKNIHNIPPEFNRQNDQIAKRLSLKVTNNISDDIKSIMCVTKMTKTDVVKSLVVQINNDIIRPKTPKKCEQLRMLAAVSAG